MSNLRKHPPPLFHFSAYTPCYASVTRLVVDNVGPVFINGDQLIAVEQHRAVKDKTALQFKKVKILSKIRIADIEWIANFLMQISNGKFKMADIERIANFVIQISNG